jgi:hypothetical protein
MEQGKDVRCLSPLHRSGLRVMTISGHCNLFYFASGIQWQRQAEECCCYGNQGFYGKRSTACLKIGHNNRLASVGGSGKRGLASTRLVPFFFSCGPFREGSVGQHIQLTHFPVKVSLVVICLPVSHSGRCLLPSLHLSVL